MISKIKTRAMLTTALVTTSSVFFAVGANAAPYGIIHTGTDTLTVTFDTNDLIEGDKSGIFGANGAVVIDNAGTIRGNGTYDGFAAPPDAGVTIAREGSSVVNSGTISGAGAGITTAYYFNAATGQLEPRAIGTTVTNGATGTIRGESNDGVRLIGGGSVTNSGIISGTGSEFADGVSMFAYGAQDTTGVTAIGTVTNLAGGTISGQRFGIILTGGGIVNNAGTVGGSGPAAILIQSFDPAAGHVGQLTNSGLIDGGATLINVAATVDNSGTIRGASGLYIGGSAEPSTVTNSGTITGTAENGVYHGGSGLMTLTNAAGGTIIGEKRGVFAEHGAIAINNAGTIRGNGTVNYVEGPGNADAGIVILQAGSSVINSGTISGAKGGIITDYYNNPQTGLSEGRAIGTVIANSGTIVGEGNDGVRLVGGGSVTNSGTIEGRVGAGADGVNTWAFDGQALDGGPIATVTNEAGGVIKGNYRGVAHSSGGVVDNAGAISGGAMGVQIQNGHETLVEAHVTNSGTITGGDGVVIYGNISASTITNSGTITGTADNGTAGYGVYQSGLGLMTLTNAAGGTITGAKTGVFGDNGGIAINNAGTITGGEAAILVTTTVANARADITNSGTINGLIGLTQNGDRLVNSGTINGDVLLGAGDDLVTLQAGSAISGTIAAGDGNDTIVLAGTSGGTQFAQSTTASNAAQSIGRIDGAEQLSVQSGDWSTAGAVGAFDQVTIAAGASLTINEVVGPDGPGSAITTASLVADGSLAMNFDSDFDFLGDFSGTGELTKMGAGTLTFSGNYSFVGVTHILAGSVRIAGTMDPETRIDLGGGTLDISDTPQTIAELSGGEESSIIVDGSTLTVDQDSSTEFAGNITGDGSLVVKGDGVLNLTGDSSYTGPTTVEDGMLKVNGSIVSTVTVEGGMLGGNGTVGGLVVESSGMLAPGNSIGHLQVAGDVSFAAGSVYEVEVDANGAADRISATGTATISGGTVQVLAANGQYRPRTDYTILSADGGVSGQFSNVTSNLAFLTPQLGYSANAVTLSLLRNDVDFAAVATTSNQVATANAVEALGIGNELHEAVLVQSAVGAQAAYDALSGEIYASVPSAMIQDSRHVRDALLSNIGGEDGIGIWGEALGSWGEVDASHGIAKMPTEYRGLIAGLTFNRAGLSIGIGGGASNADYRMGARSSSTDADTQFVGGQLGYRAGSFAIRAGAAFAWHDVATSRAIVFPAFSESLTAKHDGNTQQFFGEVGYGFAAGPFALEPFARYAHVRTKTDGFSEKGGTAVLTVTSDARNIDLLYLGLKTSGDVALGGGARLAPRLSVAWQHGWGDLEARSAASFEGAANGFSVAGAPLPRNAVTIDGGFAVELGSFTIGAAYVGSVAEHWADHGVKASLGWRF